MLAYIICGDSTGDDSPMANLMLSVIGAVAEFEYALILGRQRGALQVKGMLCNKHGQRLLFCFFSDSFYVHYFRYWQLVLLFKSTSCLMAQKNML